MALVDVSRRDRHYIASIKRMTLERGLFGTQQIPPAAIGKGTVNEDPGEGFGMTCAMVCHLQP